MSNLDSNLSSKLTKNIVDLDLIVEKWINYMWEKTKSKNQKHYELEDLEIVVDWKKMEIIQDDAKFEAHELHKNVNSQTLFRTFFTNRTEQEQEYSFKTERVTSQSVGFSFMKGFSREKEGNITFKLPQEILEIAGGIKSQQSVECGKDQVKEEVVSWSVDSIIKVAPKTRTAAELVITELEMERNFNVDTYLKGRLSVVLNSKKDQTFVKSFVGDIVQIVTLAQDKVWMPHGSRVQILNVKNCELVKIEFSGTCNFRLGIEQHINLKEEKFN